MPIFHLGRINIFKDGLELNYFKYTIIEWFKSDANNNIINLIAINSFFIF